jgi:hypothetical protein
MNGVVVLVLALCSCSVGYEALHSKGAIPQCENLQDFWCVEGVLGAVFCVCVSDTVRVSPVWKPSRCLGVVVGV